MTSSQVEAIVASATRLFAALGYDGTSTRQIAEAAGFNIATVNYHVGAKRELYLAVMERAHLAERAALAGALAEAPPADDPVRAIHVLIDRYLDFLLERPEVSALWMHRWLSDADDIAELELQYVRPLLAMVMEGFEGRLEGDLESALWTVIWCVNGYVMGGQMGDTGRRRAGEDPAALRRFRRHLHRQAHMTLGLAGEWPR
ncbi:TetR/AcrR family transcriptional regulator [Nonomuraea soli]|uniref:AcrR family transcriptional regulator n=1 Tax=Nonomuraea soli TaxID=1032476 RepID=A0A7W0HTH6_9ACTN|nr:TetR/AcrR family transcriptional regulator [Nonomuraea soli]MBA2894952.1 AcrR family transcriptional regulator [Nonomuraea soli]